MNEPDEATMPGTPEKAHGDDLEELVDAETGSEENGSVAGEAG